MSTVPNNDNSDTCSYVQDGFCPIHWTMHEAPKPTADDRLADNADFRDGYAEGFLGALDAMKAIRDERANRLVDELIDETVARWEREQQQWRQKLMACPEWCILDHDAKDDARDDLALHMAEDHTDSTVRKLLDAHQLEIQVARTDCPSEGRPGKPRLYVRCEVELTTWEQAAELSRTILDGFGYLQGADRD